MILLLRGEEGGGFSEDAPRDGNDDYISRANLPLRLQVDFLRYSDSLSLYTDHISSTVDCFRIRPRLSRRFPDKVIVRQAPANCEIISQYL